jgi:hypothetical protein
LLRIATCGGGDCLVTAKSFHARPIQAALAAILTRIGAHVKAV